MSKKEKEDYTIPKWNEFESENRKTIRSNLEKCMNAPKLKPTLENGYINDNLDLFRELRSNGRRRNFSNYFSKPYSNSK